MSLSRAAEAGSSNKFAAGFFFAGDSKAKSRQPARNFFHEEAAKPEAAAGAAAEKPASNLPPPPDAAHRIDVNSATADELLEVPGQARGQHLLPLAPIQKKAAPRYTCHTSVTVHTAHARARYRS